MDPRKSALTDASSPYMSNYAVFKHCAILATLICAFTFSRVEASPLFSSNVALKQEWMTKNIVRPVTPEFQETENAPDLTMCVLVVTMDGNISLVSARRGYFGAEEGVDEHASEEAEVVWTLSSGGGIIASYQNPSQIYRYSIVPTLDGEGLVYIEGSSRNGVPTIRRLPLSPRRFAEDIGSYSHTPDGVTYWKESSQTLLYINLYTGEVERLGAGSSNSGVGNNNVAASDDPVLVLSRVTTTVHAADVMSRQEIFNFTYSEVVPGTLLQHSFRANEDAPGTEQHARESRSNDKSMLHAYVDGTLRGRFGRVTLGSVAVRAYMFRRADPRREDFVPGPGPVPPSNTSQLRLQELPMLQLIGDEESTTAGSSLVLRPKFPSSVLIDSITTAFQDPILARAVMAATGVDATITREQLHKSNKPASYITTLLDGGDQFGSFAVSFLRPESPIFDYDRLLLPGPLTETNKPSSALVRTPTPSGAYLGWNPLNMDATGYSEGANLWAPDEGDVCMHPRIGYAENDLDMFCIAASRKAVPDTSLMLSPSPPPTMPIIPVADKPNGNLAQVVAFVVVAQIAAIVIIRVLLNLFRKRNNASETLSVEALPKEHEGAALSPVVEKKPPAKLVSHLEAPGVTRVVGNILLTEDLLGVGSNNTLVYSGYTSELGVLRPAAIKQLVRSNYSSALKEIENLKKLSTHDNILNYYLCEQNDHFLFMALQLCRMSLRNFVGCLQRIPSLCEQSLHATTAPPDSVRIAFRQLADAVAHLHKRGVVHRDIKPHNILLDEIRPEDPVKIDSIYSVADISKFKLKLSDLGLSKGVAGDEESFGSQSLAHVQSVGGDGISGVGLLQRDAVGTLGWQAPELVMRRLAAKGRFNAPLDLCSPNHDVMANEVEDFDVRLELGMHMNHEGNPNSGPNTDLSLLRLTNRIDIFSLGCVFHFTLLPGMHPFGEGEQRDSNIVAGQCDLRGLAYTPDAQNLVGAMVESRPQLRPSSIHVCAHPFFWPSQRRLEFLELLYARLRREGERSRIVRDFDLYSRDVLLPHAISKDAGCIHWGACLSADFRHEIENPPHGIVYDTASVYSCLRFIRHKKSHFDEIIGRTRHQLSLPEGYCRYFESRFPRLLMYCVWFATRNLALEPDFDKFNLHLLAKSPFFSSGAPPVAVGGACPPQDTPGAQSRLTIIQRGASDSERDVATEAMLPCRVLHSIDREPSHTITKSRGYYYVDSASAAFVAQLKNDNDNYNYNMSLLPGKLLLQPASGPSACSAGEWRRGLAVATVSPSAALPPATIRAADAKRKTTVSLLISDVYIPPMRPEDRAPHIVRALDSDRYRTELCRDWEESGYSRISGSAKSVGQPKRQHCGFRRGQKLCDYAHGPLELRCKGIQRLSYYVSAEGGASQRRQVVRYSEGDVVGRWGISTEYNSSYETCASMGPLLEARKRLRAAAGTKMTETS